MEKPTPTVYAVSVRIRLDVARADIQVGDLVEGGPIREKMAVVARCARLEDHGVVSELELARPNEFAAAVNGRVERVTEMWALTLGTVEEPGTEGKPGWCSVSVPEMGAGTTLPAQLITWGGGNGTGPTLAPARGATVVVAMMGDGIMPRLTVLGVCNHANNAPATADEGTFTMVLGTDGSGATVRIGQDGRMSIESKEKIELSAATILLKGSSIEMKKK